jgi:hypothetical protein
VGRLGKRLLDFRGHNIYVAIKNILRARATDFVMEAYGCEIGFIGIIQNVYENIDRDFASVAIV